MTTQHTDDSDNLDREYPSDVERGDEYLFSTGTLNKGNSKNEGKRKRTKLKFVRK